LLRNLILLAGILLMLLDANFYAFSEQLQLKVFIIGIIFFGIPHGGADRLIASKNFSYKNGDFSKQRFNLVYLGNLALFSLLLFCFPVLGFVTFVFLSAYHFGESDLQALDVQTISGKITSFNYGLLILGLIFLPEFQQIQVGIGSLSSDTRILALLDCIKENNLTILAVIFVGFVFNSLVYFSFNKTIFRKSHVPLLQNIVLIPILYKLPPLLSFSFYFLLWHSVLSLRNILTYLLKDGTVQTGTIFKEIIKNSGIATVGIAVFGLAGYLYSGNNNLIIYAVLGLAVLTASHIQIMHQMYDLVAHRKRKQLV
jgi:Brp/Blh family beta-carotene 15,15'-monooxygenase